MQAPKSVRLLLHKWQSTHFSHAAKGLALRHFSLLLWNHEGTRCAASATGSACGAKGGIRLK
jgi:hypothetical protein